MWGYPFVTCILLVNVHNTKLCVSCVWSRNCQAVRHSTPVSGGTGVHSTPSQRGRWLWRSWQRTSRRWSVRRKADENTIQQGHDNEMRWCANCQAARHVFLNEEMSKQLLYNYLWNEILQTHTQKPLARRNKWKCLLRLIIHEQTQHQTRSDKKAHGRLPLPLNQDHFAVFWRKPAQWLAILELVLPLLDQLCGLSQVPYLVTFSVQHSAGQRVCSRGRTSDTTQDENECSEMHDTNSFYLEPMRCARIGKGQCCMNCVGDTDLLYPALRRVSCRVSWSNPFWVEIGQDSEGEDGRKAGDVGERDRVEVFCGKCGNMWDMTMGWQNYFWHTKANDLIHAWWVAVLVHCVLWCAARAQMCRASGCSSVYTPCRLSGSFSWSTKTGPVWEKFTNGQTVKNARNSNFFSSYGCCPVWRMRTMATKATGFSELVYRTSSLFEDRPHSRILQFLRTDVLFFVLLVRFEILIQFYNPMFWVSNSLSSCRDVLMIFKDNSVK